MQNLGQIRIFASRANEFFSEEALAMIIPK
jgi:hypothetical protein